MRKVIGFSGIVLVSMAAVAIAYTAQQAARGQRVFAQQCASCHGAKGQGGTVPSSVKGFAGMKVPPVAGKGALPNMTTAENVYMFIKQAMPLQKPGSLSQQDYLDIVAFDLMANNVAKPNTQPLTVQQLPTIKLTPR